jgi:hypothetical protein
MVKDTGLIIRSIPYSDSARILHCFTENKGLQALFVRIPKKNLMLGHLMPGSFISFSAQAKPGSTLLSIKESRWDQKMPTEQIHGEQHLVWLFTLELLHKSLKEAFPLPHLLQRIRVYYALLCQGEINTDPLIALVTISGALGLSDVQMVYKLADEEIKTALVQLGWGVFKDVETIPQPSTARDTLFNLECDRFQQHFNIDQLDSLYLFRS